MWDSVPSWMLLYEQTEHEAQHPDVCVHGMESVCRHGPEYWAFIFHSDAHSGSLLMGLSMEEAQH